MSTATERGKTVEFVGTRYRILNGNELVGIGTKFGELFYLNCSKTVVSANVTDTQTKESVEYIWHCRFGHLGSRNLEKLAKDKLVCGFNYDPLKTRVFCQPCIDGKIHKKPFPTTGGTRANKPLELVHSDVCGPHLSVDVIIFLPLLTTILGMCGYTF